MTNQNKITFNKLVRRHEPIEFMANQAPAAVAMEACYTSHYWARRFQDMGYQASLHLASTGI